MPPAAAGEGRAVLFPPPAAKKGLRCVLCPCVRGSGGGIITFPPLTCICHNFAPWLAGQEGGGESTLSIFAGSVGNTVEGYDHPHPPAGGAAQGAGRSREPQLALREPVALFHLPWRDGLIDSMCMCVLWSFQAPLRDSKSSPRSWKLPVRLPELPCRNDIYGQDAVEGYCAQANPGRS